MTLWQPWSQGLVKCLWLIESIYSCGMTSAELRAFNAVVAAGGFSSAARAAGLRQPTISAQVAALERRCRAQLIDRRTGQPTAIGIQLYDLTRPLFVLENEIRDLLARAAIRGPDVVRIVTDGPAHITSFLEAARHRLPQARFEIGTANSAESVKRLLDGRADIAVAADVSESSAIRRWRLSQQDLVAAVRVGHPLATSSHVSFADIAAETIIAREDGSGTRTAFERAAADAGVAFGSRVVAEGREAVITAVVAGFGVGIFADDEIIDDPRVAMIDIFPRVTLSEYMICRSDDSRAEIVESILTNLRKSVADPN